ncbi:MAG: response regulator receiver protein [Fibrobacteres bacterium]|nr:response regulator receiver protein [Fibrobacterota bacterium]
MNRTAGSGRIGILLAEDDEVVATIVVQKLEREGYKVEHVTDGEAALTAARTGTFAIFIFDVKMPGLDGFDLLERIKEEPGIRKTPVLMLTGKKTDTDVLKGIKLGADDYMVKPFMPFELALRVRKLLSRSASGNPG